MLAAGGHYWNASMFVWRVDRILADYRKFLPATADALDALAPAIGTERYEHVLADVWERTDRTTIDYGIAERADKVAVVPADIGWEDVGSWARLAEIVTTSENWAAGDHVAEGSSGNYVWAPGKTVALIGVDNLIVVDTEDALLIATKERSEEVKTIVERLRRDDRGELL